MLYVSIAPLAGTLFLIKGLGVRLAAPTAVGCRCMALSCRNRSPFVLCSRDVLSYRIVVSVVLTNQRVNWR